MKSAVLAVGGIQARMSSKRLPGKMLADLEGRPLIVRVFERASACPYLERLFVLTSEEASDDALAAVCEQYGIPVRRGSLRDVASRFSQLADEFDPKFIVRITGDCPLVDPNFIERQLLALDAWDADFTRFDHGQSLGGVLGGQTVMSSRALRRALQSTDLMDREHVGSFFFGTHSHLFRYVASSVDEIFHAPGIRLTVDEAPDLEFMRSIYARFCDPSRAASCISLSSVLEWLNGHPEICQINASIPESSANRAARRLRGPDESDVIGRWP